MNKYQYFSWLKYCFLALPFVLNNAACINDKSTKETLSEKAGVIDSAAQTRTEKITDTKPEIPVEVLPEGFKELAREEGDLDKDGLPERVIIYDTPNKTDMGTQREIRIYKIKNDAWQLWHTSVGAVLPSEHGGMMGDPFDGVGIENGALVFSHFGGSRQKWKYTHRFRYQKEHWELIGATVRFGSPCDYWEDFDYNLSTGNVVYEKTVENCDNDELTSKVNNKNFASKLEKLPEMDGFYPGIQEIVIEGTDEVLFY